MKKIALFTMLLALSFGAFAQTTWTSDPYHSKLGFTVTHLGIADVPGHFKEFALEIISSAEDFSDAQVSLSVKTNSIDTRVESRDNHLKSADFFDVAKYPEMTFKSTSIKKSGKNTYKLTGNLSLHGVTKPITVTMEYRGTTANPNAKGAPVAGILVMGTIDRSDFAVGNGFPAPMISDEVIIKADAELGHKK